MDQEYQDALYLKSQGDNLEAINVLNSLEKRGYNQSEVLSQKALIYQELGNLKAAQSALKSAVKSDVRNLDALEQLRAIKFPGRIAATARYPDEDEPLRKAGASEVFNIYAEAGNGFASHVSAHRK